MKSAAYTGASRTRPWTGRLAGLVAAIGLLGVAQLIAPATTLAAPVHTAHLELELVADGPAVPGKTLHVALRQVIAPGWHTYWRNPGDAGEATEITWTLPAGWSADPILWPAPERALTGPLMNYVYSEKVLLPSVIHVAPSAQPGAPMTISAHASLLVCKDVCVPEEANLSLPLPVSAQSVRDPVWGGAIAATLSALPHAQSGATFSQTGSALQLSVSGPAVAGATPADIYFFPYAGTVIDHAKPQIARVDGDHLSLSLPAGYDFTHGRAPPRLAGVISLGHGRSIAVDATAGSPASGAAIAQPAATTSTAPGVGTSPPQAATAVASQPAAAAPPPAGAGLGLPLALVFALLGGLILNLMPCVFPVLSIKAAALARHTEHPAAARHEGLAYLAGVIVTFVGLAAALIAARHAGEAVGWGFQLQSPGTVAVLTLVMLGSALNLSGLFEFGLSAQGAGSDLAGRSGLSGAFFTGVLAVVVAAPCTGPFMASTIGWALAQSELTALLVFAALGVGLALPFVALAFAPGLHRLLPRPGAWMEGLRKFLAFPMYGAAAWLAWVFAEEAGTSALPALYAAGLALAFAVWLWGVSQRAETDRLRLTARIGAVVAIVAVVAALNLGPKPQAPSAGAAPSGAAASGALAMDTWTPTRAGEVQATGRPVFVDFTAAWCVTCKVNEAGALGSPRVIDAFRKANMAYLRADWTNRNADIAHALQAQGRAGVPLYLVYDRRGGAPKVLPQLLTEKDLLDAIAVASR